MEFENRGVNDMGNNDMNAEYKPDICIYHFPCDDGFAAAWVVRQKWGDDVDFRPSNYGLPVPGHDIVGKNILIVDFSFKPDVLKAMASKAKSVVVLDHHKTAQADLAEFPSQRGTNFSDLSSDVIANLSTNIITIFDMDRSGAKMTWDFCFPFTKEPDLIGIIEDRDLWRFQYENTKLLSLYLRSFPYDFDVWANVMRDYDVSRKSTLREARAIKRFSDMKVAEIVEASIIKTIGNHCDVAVAYAPYAFVSDVGHALLEAHPLAPFACIIVDAHGGRTYSLRSNDDREDVSAVAKSFGGGGHRNAAGFRVPA